MYSQYMAVHIQPKGIYHFFTHAIFILALYSVFISAVLALFTPWQYLYPVYRSSLTCLQTLCVVVHFVMCIFIFVQFIANDLAVCLFF